MMRGILKCLPEEKERMRQQHREVELMGGEKAKIKQQKEFEELSAETNGAVETEENQINRQKTSKEMAVRSRELSSVEGILQL